MNDKNSSQKIMNIDEAFQKLRKWGRYQTVIYILVLVASIPNAFTTIQFAINHFEPSHRCRLSDEIENLLKNKSNDSEEILNYFIPKEVDSYGEIIRNECHMYNRTYSAELSFISSNNSVDIIPCMNGYIFDTPSNHDSAVTEFEMVCNNNWKAPLVITFFQTGMASGSVAGMLADRYGRRPVYLLATLAQIGSLAFIAAAWNYYVYLAAAYLNGMTGIINYVVAFVLATEVISVKSRNFMAICSLYSFSIGYAIVPLIGYYTQTWRSYLWASMVLGALIYLPGYWLFPESPRWLLTVGRKNDAIVGLKKMAKMNKMNIDFASIKKVQGVDFRNTMASLSGPIETLRIFFKSTLTSRCLAIFFVWFVAGLVYYAISYHSKSFSDDRYLNILYSALAEIPALVIAYYAVNIFGRPRCTTFSLLICGTSSIILPYLPEDISLIRTITSIIGKGAVSAVFYITYLSTSEIAPTLQRSAAMSMASFCSRIGAIVAPFVMFMNKIQYSIPNWIMGGLTILSGIICIVRIPETIGVEMPDTIQQAESNKRYYGFNIFRKFEPNKYTNQSKDNHTEKKLTTW
uniref:solute carrier family 22 member 4-like isoform X1 n=2 Tax=Styela clava TaxID=7725 RepID=UPI00193A9E1E|nr:solute carrier family 22 member 4-like isoform X1 [Styela clava]